MIFIQRESPWLRVIFKMLSEMHLGVQNGEYRFLAAGPAVIRGGVGGIYLQAEWDRAKKRLCVIDTQRRFFVVLR